MTVSVGIFDQQAWCDGARADAQRRPGGQYTNLRQQARALGIESRWREVARAYADVNRMFGDIVKVTPTSKVVGDLAVFMVTNDLTPEDVTDPKREIAFPESVVEYFHGDVGQPPGGFPKKLQKKVLKSREPLKVRSGEELADVDAHAFGKADRRPAAGTHPRRCRCAGGVPRAPLSLARIPADTTHVRARSPTRGFHAPSTLRRIAKGRRAWLALCAAALLTVGLLVAFASSLQSSQTSARRAIESRFGERATVSAALTEALFASLAGAWQTSYAKRFGALHVSAQALGALASKGKLVDLVLVDPAGNVIALSPRTPDVLMHAIQAKPAYVASVLAGQSFSLSNVTTLPGAKTTIRFAQPLVTPFGRRVLVSGFAPRLLYALISGYLAAIPNTAGGHAYVLDGHGAVVGGPARAGLHVGEPGLLAAVSRARSGSFGTGATSRLSRSS